MKPRELLLEARKIASEVPGRITERVLKQASDLKPEYVSLVNKIRETYILISNLMDSLLNIIREDIDVNNVVNIGKNLYVAFYNNGFYVIRSKPFNMILSYRRDRGELHFKTRKMNIILSSNYINASLISMKTSIELSRVDSYINNYRELKYIVNYSSRLLEKYLFKIIETRVKITK